MLLASLASLALLLSITIIWFVLEALLFCFRLLAASLISSAIVQEGDRGDFDGEVDDSCGDCVSVCGGSGDNSSDAGDSVAVAEAGAIVKSEAVSVVTLSITSNSVDASVMTSSASVTLIDGR
jgi:hypothetical protein